MPDAINYCDGCGKLIMPSAAGAGQAVVTGDVAMCQECLTKLPAEKRKALTGRVTSSSSTRRTPTPRQSSPRRLRQSGPQYSTGSHPKSGSSTAMFAVAVISGAISGVAGVLLLGGDPPPAPTTAAAEPVTSGPAAPAAPSTPTAPRLLVPIKQPIPDPIPPLEPATGKPAPLLAPTPAGEPPDIYLLAPRKNAFYLEGTPIELRAMGYGGDSDVVKVEYYHGDKLIGQGSTAPYRVLWDKAPGGKQTVRAKAHDKDGRTNFSDPIIVTVEPMAKIKRFRASSPARIANGLLDFWPFDESSGTTAADISSTPSLARVRGGMKWKPTGGKVGGALEFIDRNSYVHLPGSYADFRGGLTFALWVFPTSNGNHARFIDIGSGESGDNIVFCRDGQNNDFVYEVLDRRNNMGRIIARNGLKNGLWQHIAVTQKSDGFVTLYRNGKSVATGSTGVPPNRKRTEAFIGHSHWPSDAPYKGMMDDVRIYNRALSAAEIQTLAGASGGAN